MKSRPPSQVIVDPQELTQFLRRSQEFSDLVSSTLQVPPSTGDDVSTTSTGNGRGKEINKGQSTPRSLRPMSTSILPTSNQQRRIAAAKKGWKRYVGIPLAIASGLLYILSFIIVKKLNKKYHPVSLGFWQFGVYFLLSIPILLYFRFWLKVKVFASGWKNEVVRANFRKKAGIVAGVVITCISGVTVLVLQFVVLKYLQVGDATIIAFSGSLFTIGFGHFFLYEKCGFITIPVSCFILFGIFLMTRPPFLTGEEEYNIQLLIGVSLALLTTILASGYLIAMRKLRKVHFSVMLFVGGGLGVLECGIVTAAIGTTMTPDLDWNFAWILSLGILSFLASMATLAALKYEEAGTVNLARMLDVIFSFVLQYIFLRAIPDQFSLFGATIVLTGVSIIGLRSILLTLPAENHCRRLCCCLLK